VTGLALVARRRTVKSRIPKIEIVDDRVVEILRRKAPEERLAIADGMWQFSREMVAAIIAREHADWSPERIQREVARRMSHGAV
jgi:hypothetical protein